MLIGSFVQKMDNKGRTALPSKFRKELGQEVVLARWYEGSIAIFAPVSWNRIVEQATRGLVVTSPSRDTERFLLGGAYEIALDSQGRLVVPQTLRTHGGLGGSGSEGEVVFVGLANRVELWSKRSWEEREKHVVEHAEELIEKVSNEWKNTNRY